MALDIRSVHLEETSHQRQLKGIKIYGTEVLTATVSCSYVNGSRYSLVMPTGGGPFFRAGPFNPSPSAS